MRQRMKNAEQRHARNDFSHTFLCILRRAFRMIFFFAEGHSQPSPAAASRQSGQWWTSPGRMINDASLFRREKLILTVQQQQFRNEETSYISAALTVLKIWGWRVKARRLFNSTLAEASTSWGAPQTSDWLILNHKRSTFSADCQEVFQWVVPCVKVDRFSIQAHSSLENGLARIFKVCPDRWVTWNGEQFFPSYFHGARERLFQLVDSFHSLFIMKRVQISGGEIEAARENSFKNVFPSFLQRKQLVNEQSSCPQTKHLSTKITIITIIDASA